MVPAPLVAIGLLPDGLFLACPETGSDPHVLVSSMSGMSVHPSLGTVVRAHRSAADEILAGHGESPAYQAFLAELGDARELAESHAAFTESIAFTDADALRAILERHPISLTDEFLDYLDCNLAVVDPEDPFDRHLFHSQRTLFQDLRDGVSVDEAVNNLARMRTTYIENVMAPEFLAVMTRLATPGPLTPERNADFKRAITLCIQQGRVELQQLLHSRRATERLDGGSLFTEEDAAAAVADLRAARDLAPEGTIERAGASSDLALALARSPLGTPVARSEEAIALCEEALQSFSRDEYPEQWAMISTNLSILYLEREGGDPLADAEHAAALCRSALELRPRDLEPLGWAYSTFNLGHALVKRANRLSRETDPVPVFAEADDLLDQAATGFLDLDMQFQAGRAFSVRAGAILDAVQDSIARRRRRVDARVDAEDIQPDFAVTLADLAVLNPAVFGLDEPPRWAVGGQADRTPRPDEQAALERARTYAGKALELTPSGGDSAMTRHVLADIERLLGANDTEVRGHLEAALVDLAGYDVPSTRIAVSASLGTIAARQRDWSAAASAFLGAMEVVDDFYVLSRSSSVFEKQFADYYKIVEWAAYCLTLADRPAEAVQILEEGRARTLSAAVMRDEPAMDRLSATDPHLAHQVTRALLSATGAPGPAALAELIPQVRELPGLSGFLRHASLDEVVSESEAGRPLVHLVSTPAGSVCLLAVPGSTPPAVEIVSISSVTSADLVACLLQFGDEVGGLLGSDARRDAALDRIGRLLGMMFGSALAERLGGIGATEVAIVPAGIVGALPLGTALLVPDDPAGKRLADVAAVTVAPSGGVLTACRRRLQRIGSAPAHFVGIADAEEARPLPGARAELWAVGRGFGQATTVAYGAAATRSFVLDHAITATHIHLACHGTNNLGDPLGSTLGLADGPVTVRELSERQLTMCRLVVASACESGQIGIFGSTNEVIGLPNAMITAGAAATVASLWPVDDVATTVLMSRFYERLRELEGECPARPGAPAVALRDAQAWTRSVPSRELDRIADRIEGHAADTPDGVVSSERGLVATLRAIVGKPDTRPFEHPRYWAPFVVIGL
ncbi:CHAT domain-containing protein [Pseudonocardia sp. RS11V-5]|uniref:CHAT domain-containing protein n=1 Tax=Pseudonocardia terrae TaxID=2905831 RepID=UPI001E3381C1|nr:CHAT domain-containing protein [Pseudonocardia terrae]MCE3555568.1 CHAT domain-containing protein [Pseudonocardia terrae]